MASTTIDVSARDLMAKNVTMHVKVRGLSLAMLRVRLSLPILWLAAKVAGVGLTVDTE